MHMTKTRVFVFGRVRTRPKTRYGAYMPSWKVREMTSSCCSFVRLWKFTA